MGLVIAAISPRRCRIAAGLSVASPQSSSVLRRRVPPPSFVLRRRVSLPSLSVRLSLHRVPSSSSPLRMALSFLSVSGRPSASLISCLAAPPAPPPPNPNPTALPSLTCALQCPHFQSCSGCTQEYDLHRPIILDEATDFFNKHGVSDFTFDTCRLWGWRCRAKLAVRGSYTDPLIGLYQEGIAELKVEPYDEDQGTGELRYVQMAVTTYNTSLPYAERYRNGKVQVALVWNSRDENSPSSKKLNALANIIFGNRWRHLLGERDFWERVGGIDVSLAPSSFGQANTRKYVHFGASVADLYAGAGVIGLSLAATRKCRQELAVKCIEINKESKLSFEKTAEHLPNSVDSSISWHNADTSIDPLSWLVGSDVVVVDPPRKGLDPSLLNALRTIPSVERKFKPSESPLLKAKDEKRPWVLRAKKVSVQIQSKTTQEESQSLPQTLIYISCGWESFKEDCMSLLSSKAWHLDKAHGFNFFPGTQRKLGLKTSYNRNCDGFWLWKAFKVIAVKEEVGPRRRILFLGGRSFEFQEEAMDQKGHRRLGIVERGSSLRQEVILVGFEAGRQSFQIVVTIVGRQHQVFILVSEFGDGWESVALVIEGFARGESWVAKTRARTRLSVVKRIATKTLIVMDKPVQAMAEEGWFDILNRALVGLVCMEGDKGVGFSVMIDRDLHLQWWSPSVLSDKGNLTPSEATQSNWFYARVLRLLPIPLRVVLGVLFYFLKLLVSCILVFGEENVGFWFQGRLKHSRQRVWAVGQSHLGPNKRWVDHSRGLGQTKSLVEGLGQVRGKLGPSPFDPGVIEKRVPSPRVETGVCSNPSLDWVFGSLREGVSLPLPTSHVGSWPLGGMVSQTWPEKPSLLKRILRLVTAQSVGREGLMEENKERWGFSGDDMSIGVRPFVTDDAVLGLPNSDPVLDIDIKDAFLVDLPPSSDEVSDWVLTCIADVSKFWGVLFAGMRRGL
ncbi:hypothetical protein TEA_028633 [Camellia sinensis var. sinensis]|uniref:Methyltransferase small domain-containing protein n=1 Tax=Camellia sinensis var. sinensis TaxID=542762 RepID=A0A4S4EZJ0_CAMSN|nr:hypothetical protein TEA_028633 [Camellia sinensis var. sinensis]